METNQSTFVAPLDNQTGTAFGRPRDFLGNRFVYVVVSSRAGGLSVGINMNPDKACNFDCVYCEVDRGTPARDVPMELELMTEELTRTLELIQSGRIRERPNFRSLPPQLLKLQHVALSGDGEPTMCADFARIVEGVIEVRARSQEAFLKIALLTNGSGLDRAAVREGLSHFASQDEVWIKLDAGGQERMDRVNRPDRPIEQILSNILELGRERPVIIQSLFPLVDGAGPPDDDIAAYVQRLVELRGAGARISLVQIYSSTKSSNHPEIGHLPLKTLARIAERVREGTLLKTEVY